MRSTGVGATDEPFLYHLDMLTVAESPPFLEGLEVEGRLVAILSNRSYSEAWSQAATNGRELQFGVNLIVFALTQEGTLTARSMNVVE